LPTFGGFILSLKPLMKKFTAFILFYALHLTHSFSSPDFWLQKASLPAQPRAGAIAFSLNGFGYVGTGLDSSGILLNDFWKYDPSNDSWSQVATFAGSARKNAVAFVTDSFAYAGTGYDNNGLTKNFFRYDPLNNLWQPIEDLDSAGTSYPRRDAASFAIGNKGYVVGGYDGSSYYSKETWEYNPLNDTVWNKLAPFPLAGRRWAASFSIDASGFVGMGYNYSQEYFRDLWKFDPIANVWTQMADFPGNKRGYAATFVILRNAFTGTGYDGSYKNDFYRYDYDANAWAPVASFGGLPTSAASGFSVNGKGYIFGGADTLGYRNELWEYTPDNTLGIQNQESEWSVSVYPNPASDKSKAVRLNTGLVSGSRINAVHVKLYDSRGKIVLTQSLSSVAETINVGNLAPGMYYYSVSEENDPQKAVTGKLVLQ
jgi:N-acetylneuraminic acid mutarotase